MTRMKVWLISRPVIRLSRSLLILHRNKSYYLQESPIDKASFANRWWSSIRHACVIQQKNGQNKHAKKNTLRVHGKRWTLLPCDFLHKMNSNNCLLQVPYELYPNETTGVIVIYQHLFFLSVNKLIIEQSVLQKICQICL